jgi:hypothetical protein
MLEITTETINVLRSHSCFSVSGHSAATKLLLQEPRTWGNRQWQPHVTASSLQNQKERKKLQGHGPWCYFWGMSDKCNVLSSKHQTLKGASHPTIKIRISCVGSIKPYAILCSCIQGSITIPLPMGTLWTQVLPMARVWVELWDPKCQASHVQSQCSRYLYFDPYHMRTSRDDLLVCHNVWVHEIPEWSTAKDQMDKY